MEQISIIDNRIDLICQHCRDGRIIPIKIRIIDGEGSNQVYVIKSFKQIESGDFTHTYSCQVEIFGIRRTVCIYYSDDENVWRYRGVQ